MARTPFRSASLLLPLLLPVSLGSALAVADDPVAAIPVSPGDSQGGALIGNPCPSFSWGAVEGAQRYELAIFDAQWDDSPGYAEQARQGIALRRIEIDAPALSWTPAGSECLDEGGSYLWFVRAATAAEEEEPWSAPRYFAIDYDADALTQTVRRELAAQLSRPEVWREVIQAALSGNRALELTPWASAALMPPAMTDTAARTDRTGGASAGETLAISPQATTFPNPSALKVNSPNGVVFNQSADGGGIPAEGDGARFMWYPGKGALRAGYVNGTQWDDVNVGWYSVALGINTTARGSPSTALGIGTTASGYYSTALGVGTTAQSYAETVLGSYNTLASYPDDDQWVSTDRLFVIGNGDYEGTASNALVVLKNGRTGIGHSTPKARLNVRSDGQWRWDVGDGWGDFSIDNGTYGLAFGVATGGAGAGHSYIWAKGGAQGIYFGNPTDGILLNVGYGKTVSFGELEVRALGTAGATALCRNAVNEIATCSSSGRYKEAIVPLERGLEAALQLRPVTFDWKDGQGRDLGFVAEEVAAIDSLLVTHNEQGQIEGVKYGPLTAVLVKALQEQQAQIAALHKENAALAQRLRVQEFYAAQRSSERSDEMALIRAELQRLREQMSAQSSMQRTAALP